MSVELKNIDFSGLAPAHAMQFLVWLTPLGSKLPLGRRIAIELKTSYENVRWIRAGMKCLNGWASAGSYRVHAPSNEVCSPCRYLRNCIIREIENARKV